MRIDCFLYNGEIEVLTLRLATLGAAVDRFVLVEADRTFRGHAKPLHFAAVKGQFAAWGDRLRHIALAHEPSGLTPGAMREGWQRDQIARGLSDAPDDAQILIGDVDEIPDPARLRAGVMRQTLYYYDARTVCTSARWLGTVATDVATVRRLGAEGVRRRRDQVPIIEAGGWHFSYTGGVGAIHAKIRAISYAAKEPTADTPATHAAVADRVAAAEDIFGRGAFTFVRRATLDDDLPAPLRADPTRWPGLARGQWT